MQQLNTQQQQALMSDYLQKGWKQEVMEFSSVHLEPGYIIGLIDVKYFQMPGGWRVSF